MKNITQFQTTVQFDDALLAATDAALAAAPDAQARILKGYGLVQADAVTDCTRLEHGWFTVRSATRADALYNVRSNGHTTCTCRDYERHADDPEFLCKHGYAVLLVRKARKLYTPPQRKRHAYYMPTGEEGHARVSRDGMHATFWPGGRKRSFHCSIADLCIGPEVTLTEQAA